MPDETPQKRVLPPRERRESAAKRLARSPVQTPAPTSTSAKKAPTAAFEPRLKRKYTKRASRAQTITPGRGISSPVAEDVLPTRVTSSKPLPTSRTKAPSSISSKQYQSIAESGILAASLERSRKQWLVDGIFKKYWTKPIKRKGVIDVPTDNPDVKSMTKLGNGQITIEPHKFEVTFYTVRDVQAPLPYYRHPNQHTTKQPGLASSPFPGASVSTSLSQPAGTPVIASSQPATPNVKQENGPAKPKSNTDPVIQMLAQRASSDSHLKELMKVVATSKASPEQLKEFQKHIDEFNAIVKKQEAERKGLEATTTTKADPLVVIPQTDGPSEVKPIQAPSAAQTPIPTVSTPPIRPPAPAASFPPPPRPEPIIKHIVIEFHGEGASVDRWIFPPCAALDIKYGGLEMLASFLVERKGSEIIASMVGDSPEETAALQSKWKPSTDYHQAVTILVRANQHRTIETIARAAKTLPEVQEHMKKVLKEQVRAPQEYLVHQLPRDKGQTIAAIPTVDFVDSAIELGSDAEDDELKDFYGN